MRTLFVGVVVSVFLAAFCPSELRAQNDWRLGVKGGLTQATMHGSVSGLIDVNGFTVAGDLNESRQGFAAGGFVTAFLSPSFALQVEALYVQKGGKGTTTVIQSATSYTNIDVTVELDYFEVPVLAVLYFPAGGIDFSAYGGFGFAFNTGAKVLASVGGTAYDINIESLVDAVDVGGIVGLGVSFKVSSLTVEAEGRWDYSVNSMNSGPANRDIRNGAGMVMAGIAVPLGIAK